MHEQLVRIDPVGLVEGAQVALLLHVLLGAFATSMPFGL